MAVKFLNVHDLVGIKVTGGSPCLIQDFNCPLRYFAVPETSAADLQIQVRLGSFCLDTTDCQPVDHKYYVRDGYVAFREKIGRFRFHGAVRFSQNGAEIDFCHDWRNYLKWPRMLYADLTAYQFVIQPVLRVLLAKRGYYLLHGGACTKDGQAIFFGGRGGIHKTSLVLALMRCGWSYLGDDMVLIGGNGNALAYPLFPGRLDWLYHHKPDECMQLWERPGFFLSLMHDKIDFPIESQANLSRVLLLHCQPGIEEVSRLDWSREAVIRSIVLSTEMEHMSYPQHKQLLCRFLEAYIYAMPTDDLLTAWEKMEKVLRQSWAGLPVEGYAVPAAFAADSWLSDLGLD